MSNPEIRMFDVKRGRDGGITHAVVCNAQYHFNWTGVLGDIWSSSPKSNCDGIACQAPTSETLDVSLLSSERQSVLGLQARVPPNTVLVTDLMVSYLYRQRVFTHVFGSGSLVTPKLLEAGRLLADGDGTTYYERGSKTIVYYVRNVAGKPEVKRVGKEGRARTEKKLADLRRGERKSEVSYEVSLLNTRILELMQLHRTPKVQEAIENVKELLRLASSLSIEASFEAAESNEEIARELANSRAHKIAAELQSTRELLLLEKTAREEARKELEQGF